MHQSTQSKELGQFEHRYEAANSTPINAEVLERLLCSRRDLARLTDHKSFAHLKLSANTLVRDPEDVEYFLRTLGMYCSRNINLSMYYFMFQISSQEDSLTHTARKSFSGTELRPKLVQEISLLRSEKQELEGECDMLYVSLPSPTSSHTIIYTSIT